MTTDASIRQLMKDRDNMAHQISNREKEIAHLTKRLKDSLMSNQKALLQAQRARQATMLDADRGVLANLEASLARSAQK
jgi:hypothetical protein